MKEIFAERLQYILWKSNMTQKELSETTGLTAAAISHYVNGTQCPHSPSLVLIADALNVSTDFLLGRTNKPKVLR